MNQVPPACALQRGQGLALLQHSSPTLKDKLMISIWNRTRTQHTSSKIQGVRCHHEDVSIECYPLKVMWLRRLTNKVTRMRLPISHWPPNKIVINIKGDRSRIKLISGGAIKIDLLASGGIVMISFTGYI